MKSLTTDQLRQAYLDFFKSKGHAIIPGAPLVPENDPTVLFTTAGMHPLVPYLLGAKHPAGTRLTDVQRCVRTGDIDEVGDASHLTMFEMMGNWSLGDYFKEGAIEMSFEFLTKVLEIPLEKFAVTCFEGDADCPRDEESAKVWERLGVPRERIGFLPKAKNWWGPAGKTGPCGPDSEMFYWVGPTELPPAGSNPATDDPNWMEIWNDVFMQYNKKMTPLGIEKDARGEELTSDDFYFEPLKQQNVDTGMGLERVAAVLQGVSNVYETDRMDPIMKAVFPQIKSLYQTTKSDVTELLIRHIRIIVDHVKASTFIIADGVKPSNVDQGYVLRRLIRRGIRSIRRINIENYQSTQSVLMFSKVAEEVINQYSNVYPNLLKKKIEILNTLQNEEAQFSKTLHEGLKQFELMISIENAAHHATYKIKGSDEIHSVSNSSSMVIDGKNAFHLYDTYGFPLELTQEMAAEKGMSVDEAGFQKAFEEHQAKSRAGAAQKFAGGLADHSAETTKLHTATHLLNAALHKVLGDHISQKGSNITAERLRFDFNHADKMTPEQIAEAERLVNDAIKADLPITFHLTTVEGAKSEGAIGVFDDRYGSEVKVYVMGDDAKGVFSKEICGGPHVARTGMLGSFKIQKEESSSAGVRRIKAIVEGGPAEIEMAAQAA